MRWLCNASVESGNSPIPTHREQRRVWTAHHREDALGAVPSPIPARNVDPGAARLSQDSEPPR
jgi:anti-sigma factor RsiW